MKTNFLPVFALTLILNCSVPLFGAGPIQEVTFGDKVTLTGTLEEIKTYDEDGKAVFPFFINTERPLIVLPDQGFAPADSEQELNGLEVKMLNGNDEVLEQFRNKRVKIHGRVATGVDLYCYDIGIFVESLDDISVQ